MSIKRQLEENEKSERLLTLSISVANLHTLPAISCGFFQSEDEHFVTNFLFVRGLLGVVAAIY